MVAAKITNTDGDGKFIASTSYGHVSNAQVRCSEIEEEGWWREDFNSWHWPTATQGLQNDGSSLNEVSGVSEEAYWVTPASGNSVPEFFCRWNLCGINCSTLGDIQDRASRLSLKELKDSQYFMLTLCYCFCCFLRLYGNVFGL